jgi:hypothetical protein
MTHESGFHMKLKNCGVSGSVRVSLWRQRIKTNLEESVLLLALELVRAKETKTALNLSGVETTLRALKQSEDVLENDGLKVDLLLIVEVLCLEFDLKFVVSRCSGNMNRKKTHLSHVDLGVCRGSHVRKDCRPRRGGNVTYE